MLNDGRLILYAAHPAYERSEPDLLQQEANPAFRIRVWGRCLEGGGAATNGDNDEGRYPAVKANNLLSDLGYAELTERSTARAS